MVNNSLIETNYIVRTLVKFKDNYLTSNYVERLTKMPWSLDLRPEFNDFYSRYLFVIWYEISSEASHMIYVHINSLYLTFLCFKVKHATRVWYRARLASLFWKEFAFLKRFSSSFEQRAIRAGSLFTAVLVRVFSLKRFEL